MAALIADRRGQALVLAAFFLALVGAAFALGALGVGAAYRGRSQVQAAADAAALAVAKQAIPVYEFAIRTHIRECRWVTVRVPTGEVDKDGRPIYRDEERLSCTDRDQKEERAEGPLTSMIARGGWVRAVGCDVTYDIEREGVWKVCDGQQPVRQTGWAYPPEDVAPRPTAEAVLAANLRDLAASWRLVDIQAQDGTGTVTLRVQATLRENPLAGVVGRPVTLTVDAWARPERK